MEHYYIFFRCWEHFSPDFPFYEEFNDAHDDKINDAVESYMVNWRRLHKSEFDKRVRNRNKQIVTKLESRAKQSMHRPTVPGEPIAVNAHSVSSFLPRDGSKFGPGRECSLGCRNARRLGWITTDLRKFGGWSPSHRCFLIKAEGAECAEEIVRSLTGWWPTSKCRVYYDHLKPRFGYVSSRKFALSEKAVIEANMKDQPSIESDDACEQLHRLASEEAMRLGQQLMHIMEREARGTKIPVGSEQREPEEKPTEIPQEPKAPTLELNSDAIRASWGDKALDINKHGDFTVLSVLWKSFGKVVYHIDLLRALKPHLLSTNIVQINESSPEVKQAKARIVKALKTVGAPLTIENVKGKGYMMVNCDE